MEMFKNLQSKYFVVAGFDRIAVNFAHRNFHVLRLTDKICRIRVKFDGSYFSNTNFFKQ